MTRRILNVFVSSAVCLAAFSAVIAARVDDEDDPLYAQVLLLSVDGLHAVDLDRFIAGHPDSTLASLTGTGRLYSHATATRPAGTNAGTNGILKIQCISAHPAIVERTTRSS